ncbi:hypothetical protein GCM10011506_04410 [Marivirga lumbricoides]|uniref:DUF2116 family Zn-ribbon domain-containing protein n=1 Tax=Marivirga lumbricoides TaxID=1046115 RepID=A0ABQ1LC28_9BACT|nr:hypothetical protein GCM10011506_04410 [Marivirga lumbricoides]
MNTCPNCGNEVIGREGKKFCSAYCKSNYHYERNKEKENTLFKRIDKQLKTNRKLLKSFNKAGKSTIRKEKLLKEGFDPKYFTHYWKNSKGEVYLFCYEFGFLSKRDEKGIEKFILVQHQAYMN